MIKPKEQHTVYKGISKNELFLLSLIKEKNLIVFGTTEIKRLTDWKKIRIYNTLFSLTQKKMLINAKRDKYILTEIVKEKLFEIAAELTSPSYISFWTALSFYGFTEQQVKVIQLVSPEQEKKITFDSEIIEVTTFKLDLFFGYKNEEGYAIAEKEKALLDSLYQLDNCGGLDEFVKCLRNSWKELNKKKFINYLIRFNNKSMVSRTGYLIEELKLKGIKLEKLKKYSSNSFVKLNPKKQKTNQYHKKWKIIINQEIKEEVI